MNRPDLNTLSKEFTREQVVDAVRSAIDWRIENCNKYIALASKQSDIDELTFRQNLLNQISKDIYTKLEII